MSNLSETLIAEIRHPMIFIKKYVDDFILVILKDAKMKAFIITTVQFSIELETAKHLLDINPCYTKNRYLNKYWKPVAYAAGIRRG